MKLGRNEPCPCGSGKKRKKCCARTPAQPETTAAVDLGELAALVNSGRFAELEGRAQVLLQQHPQSGLLWKALGVARRMQGKDALEALEKATLLLPQDAETHSNLGNALLDLHRSRDAVDSYRRALKIAPDFADAHSNLGNALQTLGLLDEAVASYRRALQIKPQYAEAHGNLANALRRLGLLDEAVASYRRALQFKPDFAEAHSNLGNALRGLGRLEEAAASYRRALQIRPSYAEACNNLGNALLDLGRVDEAAASYRRALLIKTDFVEAHNNLGNALRSLGRPEEAAASYRRALASSPDFAGAHSNLGDALRDLGQAKDAAASCRRALDIDPRLAGAHNSLGNALLDLGRLEEAAASYRRALELDPSFAKAYINLGIALRLNGRAGEAQSNCRKALEIQPDAAAAMVLLAELQADDGHFTEAESLFRRAIVLDPESPEGWAGIAHLRKMTADDVSWLEHSQRLAARSLPPRQEVYLRYAIGKYFDDLKQFDHAFANYRRANDLSKLYVPRHDRQEVTHTVDLLMCSYDQAWAGRERFHADPSSRPVFIVGMPRSGTSLAEQILASHPAVFGGGELVFWNEAAAWSVARNSQAGDGIAAELGVDYLKQLRELSADALRVVDKMPANFRSLGLIHDALPNARIIHLRRNPLDTCLSIYFQHFKASHSYANDLEDLAQYYAEYLRLMDHWQSVLPVDSLLTVPYEGLVDDQEKWSRRMLDFIGLPWDPRCLDFHRTSRSVMTASKWQVRQKISRASVDRWRNYEKFLEPLRNLMESHPRREPV